MNTYSKKINCEDIFLWYTNSNNYVGTIVLDSYVPTWGFVKWEISRTKITKQNEKVNFMEVPTYL